VTWRGLGLKAEARTDASGMARHRVPCRADPAVVAGAGRRLHDVVLSSKTDQTRRPASAFRTNQDGRHGHSIE